MKTTPIQISKELHAVFKEYCKSKGFNLQGLVERLIREELNDYQKENKKENL